MNKTKKRNSKLTPTKKAFSLIEISMIILIIGLLLIGVVGTQHMIEKARISSAQAKTRSSPINSTTDIKLWLETSLAETSLGGASSTGDAIKNWQDNSSNKVAISISAVGTGPTYSNSISDIQAIKFDETSNSNYLQIDNADFLNNTDYTIFILEKRMANNSGVKNYLLGEEGSFAVGYESETSIIQSHSQTPSADNQASIEDLSSYSDKPRMITFIHSRSDGNKIYINATLANEDNTNEAKDHLTNLTTLSIGKGYNGEIGEIAIFDRKLKTSERKEIEDYLAKKWKTLNNRDKMPTCTGTVLSDGCEASCLVSIAGSSTTILPVGGSQQISCDQEGYKGLTTQTYSCISGVLSPTPANSQCADDNGCDSGYINSSGICTTANNCTGLTITGSSVTSINHEQTSAIPCDQEGYDGFSTGYICNNGSFSAGTSCACDTANGYSLAGGVCVKQCSVSVNGSSISLVANGATQVACDGGGNYSSAPFTFPACNGSAITGSCSCNTGYTGSTCNTCDTANGYVLDGGICKKQCTIPNSTAGFNDGTKVFDGTTSVNCNASGYTGNLTYTCSNGILSSVTNNCKIACTGGTISSSNGKTIHTFLSGTTTFNCPEAKTANLLIVGGGGGGGGVGHGWAGGGGGAGGLIYRTGYSIIASTDYTVTVGSSVPFSTQGNPSSFSSSLGSLTALGGGRGINGSASSGGSGSGATNSSATLNGGLGTTGQGNNGGKSYRGADAPSSFSGGGGGACGVGKNGSVGLGGDGGDGCPIDIDEDGNSVYYAGGGGGGNHPNNVGARTDNGLAGLGGGSGRNTATKDATPNTGGGGEVYGNGASGIVIIAY